MLPLRIQQLVWAFEVGSPEALYKQIQDRRGGKVTRLDGADPLADAYDRILLALCLIRMIGGSKQALAWLGGVAKESDLPPKLLLRVQWYQGVDTMLFAFPPGVEQKLHDKNAARESIEAFQQVATTANTLKHRMFEGLALSMIAECHAWLGEAEPAKEMAAASLRLLKRQGASPRRPGRTRVNNTLLESHGACPTFTTADFRTYLYARGDLLS